MQLSWKLFIYVDLFLAFIEPPYTITPPFEGVHHHPPTTTRPAKHAIRVSYKKDDEAHDDVHDSCRQCLK